MIPINTNAHPAGAKSSYMASVPPPFKSSRLDENSERLVSTAFENFMKPRGETTKVTFVSTIQYILDIISAVSSNFERM